MKTLLIQPNSQEEIFLDCLEDLRVCVGKGAFVQIAGVFKAGWAGAPKITIEPQEGAVCVMSCVIVGKQKDEFSFNLSALHEQVRATTHVFLRSVVTDNARVDCASRMRISPSAEKSDIFFSHHTLALSPSAYSHTTPALEIQTNDVKAGHAVTVGHVDDDILLYLNSRGLDSHEATALMVTGFIAGDVGKLSSQELRSRIMQLEFEHAFLE